MRRRTILSLAIRLLVSVFGASAQSFTTLRVSGNVTWDGVGPVSGLALHSNGR